MEVNKSVVSVKFFFIPSEIGMFREFRRLIPDPAEGKSFSLSWWQYCWFTSIAWERLFERLSGLEYAPGNSFEHQPGIMLGTLALSLRFCADVS